MEVSGNTTGRLRGLISGLFPKWGEAVEAAKLRDDGMATVVEHEHGEWRAKAREFAKQYIATLEPGTFFTGEDVRVYAEKHCGNPKHHNAWGGVIGAVLRKAMSNGTIGRAGVIHANRRSSHARVYPRYVVSA